MPASSRDIYRHNMCTYIWGCRIKDMQEMARDHDDHAPLLQGVPSCGQVVYHLLSLLRWYWVRLTVTMDPDRGSNSDIRHVNRSDIFPFKFKDIAPNFQDADIFLGTQKLSQIPYINELPWRLQSMDWQWFKSSDGLLQVNSNCGGSKSHSWCL